MMASGFTALVFGSQLTVMVADKVPTLDVTSTCRAETVQTQVDAPGCLKDEQEARDQLVKEWTQFVSADKATCVGLTETGGSASYIELLTCLEMARDARSSASE
jgi:hypothetical protein